MKRNRHPKLRKALKWAGRELAHILLTFIVGVAIAVCYHEFVMSKTVRSAAEKICVVYGRDAEECKKNIDTVLNISDNEVENNINIEGAK